MTKEFLLISDTLRPVPWLYVNVTELQQILSQKIAEGFVFPLNPKWVLCDSGWKKLYDELMASDALYADLSKDVWYPPFSGVRDRIDAIHNKHPHGFRPSDGKICRRGSVAQANKTGYSPLRQNLAEGEKLSGNAAFDLAALELDDYVRHSVKHTLARQIKEAHLEDLDEYDDEDDDYHDDSSHDWDVDINDSHRSHELSERSTTSTAMDDTSTSSAVSRGLTSLMSRRTLFKTQRLQQKQEDGRYRSEDDIKVAENEEEDDDLELAAAKRVVAGRSSSAEDNDVMNNSTGELRFTPTAKLKSSYGILKEDDEHDVVAAAVVSPIRDGHRRVQTAPIIPSTNDDDDDDDD